MDGEKKHSFKFGGCSSVEINEVLDSKCGVLDCTLLDEEVLEVCSYLLRCDGGR